jgi:hypothetical protein
MLDEATTLKRTSAIVILVALCILLLAASRGYFRADEFGHLQIVKFDVMPHPITIITESEVSLAGHYRPMVTMFFWVNYLVFGLKPLGYFIVLIAVFLLTLYMFFLLARVLSGDVLGAYCAVLLFVLQGNTYLYTVNWITANSVIVSGLFVIMTLFFYVRSTTAAYRANLYYSLALISFGFGLLTREVAIVTIPMLIAYDFLFLWLEAPEKKEVLRQRFSSHVPFWVLLVGYIFLRSAVPGTLGLSGRGGYTFTLGSHVLKNLIFYGMHLGFLPVAIFLLSMPALFLDKLQLAKRDLKLIALGMLLAVGAIFPLLFFGWYSYTWMYLSAFGTTLAASVLFRRVFNDSTRHRRALLFYGTLVFALVGSFLMFAELSEARWWQWGTYSRNVIEQVQAYYPNLPPGATLCFIDRNGQEPYGIKRLFRYRSYLRDAFRVWYDDPSLQAYMVDEASSIEAILKEKGDEGTSPIFVFEYDEGSIIDKTKWVQELGE